jgi:hypothetical protein
MIFGKDKGCSGAFRPRHWLQKLYSSSSYAAIRTGSTSRAIAHTNAAISRAIAVVTTFLHLPFAASLR